MGISESDNIKIFIKAISKKLAVIVHQKSTLSVSEIETLFHVNAALLNALPYALAFSLGLFASVRIPNLVPAPEASFGVFTAGPLRCNKNSQGMGL